MDVANKKRFFLVLLLGVVASVGVWLMRRREPSLLDHARRIPGMQALALAPDYFWLNDNELMYQKPLPEKRRVSGDAAEHRNGGGNRAGRPYFGRAASVPGRRVGAHLHSGARGDAVHHRTHGWFAEVSVSQSVQTCTAPSRLDTR